MRLAALLALALGACSVRTSADAGCQAPLFGRPGTQTGLSAAQCQPACLCGTTPFVPAQFDAARLALLREWRLEAPFAEVTEDPYTRDAGASSGVCGMVPTDVAGRRYRLQTFSDVAAVTAAGGVLTHHGACGVCSTLDDLALYAEAPDLGAPVRQCGIDTFSQGFEANVRCLQALGFTRPCAQIWAWNTAHTRAKCLEPCVLEGDKPYHLSDGGLNACLACDERESGPVFKAVAGRTRRNTGLATAICRPCEETAPVAHQYP